MNIGTAKANSFIALIVAFIALLSISVISSSGA